MSFLFLEASFYETFRFFGGCILSLMFYICFPIKTTYPKSMLHSHVCLQERGEGWSGGAQLWEANCARHEREVNWGEKGTGMYFSRQEGREEKGWFRYSIGKVFGSKGKGQCEMAKEEASEGGRWGLPLQASLFWFTRSSKLSLNMTKQSQKNAIFSLHVRSW